MKIQGWVASFLEANYNTFSGFFISWCVWVWVVAPLWGYDTTYVDSFAITGIFTVSSLIRSFVIRRIMNWWSERKLNAEYELVKRGA